MEKMQKEWTHMIDVNKRMEKYDNHEVEFLSNLVDSFQYFVEEFEAHGYTKHFKHLFYAVLKTEGDILVELSQFDYAVKCYKTLKDFCEMWGDMVSLKMKTYEQIAACYRSCRCYLSAINYYKKGLHLAYQIGD